MRITVDNLTRRFGKTLALDGVSFELEAGCVQAFVGPNGAGKTTSMRIISTLDVPDQGDVFIDGVSVCEYPESARRRLGYMPDSLPAHGDIVVHEYLDFFARAYGVRQPHRSRVLAEVEEFTGLGPLREKTLASLSKGMKQRVSLARALMHDPGLLVLDEPAAGLDPHARIELRELVVALAKRGKAILISSHILHELEEMVDEVVIINRGRIVRAGSIDELNRSETLEAIAGDQPARNGTRQARRWIVRLAREHEPFQKAVLEQAGVTACRRRGARAFEIDADLDDNGSAELLRALVASGAPLLEYRLAAGGLERLFLDATREDATREDATRPDQASPDASKQEAAS